MKKLLSLILCMSSVLNATALTFTRTSSLVNTNWSQLDGWRDNDGGTWGASTRFPVSGDTVVLNSGYFVSVDTNATITTLQVVNNSSDGTVHVNVAGKTLTVEGASTVGSATQTGIGTVNVTAGTMVWKSSSEINDLLNINGGTFTVDKDDVPLNVDGSGLLKLQSGTFNNIGADDTDLMFFKADIEIHGGAVNLTGQNYFTGEFRVVGDAASISILRLNNTAANHAAFVFEMGVDGISTVDGTGAFMHLRESSIIVDGSAYTGGAGSFTLFQSSNLASTSTAVTVTNFSSGLTVTVAQDIVSDRVTLTILEEAPDDLAIVAALGDLTNAPAMRADDTTMAITNVGPGEMKAVYFDALDYTGSPTRVYAYIGIPSGASSNSPVPGVVLVHGGGGTAFDDWVTEWTNRGYAAISIAVEGQTDATNAPVMNTGWHIHNMPGPVRVGIYGDSDVEPITDQWMYHAVADTVLANSLLRSLPEVDTDNVGLMGVSWGGVITSTAIGIDDRFKFAIPTYGCGNKSIAENIYGDALGDNDLYKEVWDPMVRITNATLPVLWFSWPQEWHFPLNCQRDTYTAAPGVRMVSLVPGMQHGHPAAWNRPESYAFADSIISNGTPWCIQQSAVLSNGVATAVFQTLETLDSATLISTTDLGLTGDRIWTESPASLVDNGGGSYTVTAAVSEVTTAWIINVHSGSLIASSDFQENPDAVSPSNIVYSVSTNWSSQTVGVNDLVTITNGAVVTLDQNSASASLTVADGTLQMDQAFSLTVSGPLSINSAGTIQLDAGSLLPSGTLTVDGSLNLNGGTLSRDIAGTGFTVSGDGTLSLQSGMLAFTNGAATDVLKLNVDTQISGGSVDLDGQVYVGNNVATELTVIGDDASIDIERLNQGAGGNSGTFRFVLDETGVSTVDVSAWMNLANLIVQADGSAYTGGAGAILLLDAVNLSALANANNFSVTGFTQNGLIASIVQDPTDGNDWVQLVIEAHVPTTITFSASGDWSDFPMFGNDNVVIDSGAIVTVDIEAFANDLQVDGTLRLPLGMTGFTPMNLGAVTVNGTLEVEGSVYEGFDGYFPLILSTNLSASLENDVSFTGFGERQPAVVVQGDGLWLRLIAPPSFSDRLCLLVPNSTIAPLWSNTTFAATRDYDPSGSEWTPTFSEAHVHNTTLVQTDLSNTNTSWELRIARGGNIYSLRTPALGETVPPSYRSDTNASPWNDEVWQGVAVDSSQNNQETTNYYFTHQSGVYLQDPIQTEPFYSPQVASLLDEETRSFITVNWIPQTHTRIYTDDRTDNDYKSYILMFTRYRDLGQGLIEVSLGYYNYGPDTLDFLNMPWGGVRRTSTEYAFLSEPGGTTWGNPKTEAWAQATHFDQTGGWMGYSATSNGVTPALGFVFGEDHAVPLSAQRYDYSTFRWGYAGGQASWQPGEADWRNYFVTSIIRWYNLTQGTGVWSRYYFALADDLSDLSARIAARGLIDAELMPFDYAETNSPLIGYSILGGGSASFQCLENGTSPDFFLYAHPVNGTFPVFEILENDGSKYLTWNPHANDIVKFYDGQIAGMRLLGFSPTAVSPGYSYELLADQLPAENYLADGETLYVRTASPIETWRVEHFERTDNEGDAENLADPDNDGKNNLCEYAFGGFPTIGTNESIDIYNFPTIGNVPGGGAAFLEILYNRRINSDLIYMLEAASNLTGAAWSDNGVEEVGAGTLDSKFEVVTNTIPVDAAGFARLTVQLME
jgi:dienelactone hydrolase